MDTWDAIRSRRQVRQFTGDAIPDDTLHTILEAGRRAPSARNGQPWDFVVVRDDAQRERLAGVWQGAGWIPGAPVVVAIVAPERSEERSRLTVRYDVGQASMQLTLVATSLGVASGQAACADQDLAAEVLAFPDGHECVALIALGYPADRPLQPIKRPARRDFDDVVHFDSW